MITPSSSMIGEPRSSIGISWPLRETSRASRSSPSAFSWYGLAPTAAMVVGALSWIATKTSSTGRPSASACVHPVSR